MVRFSFGRNIAMAIISNTSTTKTIAAASSTVDSASARIRPFREPQGLKPPFLRNICGTTEVVP